MLRLHSLRQITIAHPSQWEAMAENGRPIYIRYKWGELSIYAGPLGAARSQAVDGDMILDIDVGHHHDCDITWGELVAATGIELIDAPCPAR